MVRPPGHHAERNRPMGFCLVNNAAVAASWALSSADRVAIVDWDVHHGNGTQHAFYGEPRVLYCSTHQADNFPYTGRHDEIGAGEGKGYTLNAPLMSGATVADYELIFGEVFAPAIRRMKPGAVIISAGQDILSDDPLGGMELVPEDLGRLTGIIRDAAEVPLAFVLEGGYGPSHGAALGEIVRALEDRSGSEDPVAGSPRESTLHLAGFLRNVTGMIRTG
jgi:acetoin utilization deacetylase AcuC-like enzyme